MSGLPVGDAQGNCTLNAGGMRCEVGTSLTIPAIGATVNELNLLAQRTRTSVAAITPNDYQYSESFGANISPTDDVLVSNFTASNYSVAVLPENPSSPAVSPIDNPAVLTKALGGVKTMNSGQAVRINAYCPSYVVTIDAEYNGCTYNDNFTMGQLNGKKLYIRLSNTGEFRSFIDEEVNKMLLGSYEVINQTDAVLNHRITPNTPKNLERELQRISQERWLVTPTNMNEKTVIPPQGDDRFDLPGDYVRVYIMSQSQVQGATGYSDIKPLTRNYQTSNITLYASFLVSPGDAIAVGLTNGGGVNGLVGQISKCLLCPRGNVVFKGRAVAFNQ